MRKNLMNFDQPAIKTETDSDDEGYGGPFVLEIHEDALEDDKEVIKQMDDSKETFIDNLQGTKNLDPHLPVQSSNRKISSGRKKDRTRLKCGRKSIATHLKGCAKRGRRICPKCSKSQLSTNLTRHLRDFHQIEDAEEVSRLSMEASISGRSGLRAVDFDDLPKALRDNWNIKRNRTDTYKFLRKYQLFLSEEDED